MALVDCPRAFPQNRRYPMTFLPLRIGMLTMQYPPWDRLVARWRAYEDLGFDSIWLCDHFTAARDDAPLFEAWTALAALATVTRRVRFGTVVSCAAFREASLLARQAATLDHVSNGRLEIGLRAGWWAGEHRRWGLAFPEPAERFARFRTTVEFVGRHLRTSCHCPPPIQQPRPPLVLAAQGRRMLEIAAAYADTWVASFGLRPTEIAARVAFLEEAASARGRSLAEIRRAFVWAPWVDEFDPWSSVDAFEDFVGQYAAAGVTDFIFDEPQTAQSAVFARVAGEVLPRGRDGNEAERDPSTGIGRPFWLGGGW
jgi:alkanesulfonate monooxygenase SsuD/methylene tetrahydromethanopterin reductase-like flavin-dependent oxidoreductase (luciferase family)